jgi:hypothetical protein
MDVNAANIGCFLIDQNIEQVLLRISISLSFHRPIGSGSIDGTQNKQSIVSTILVRFGRAGMLESC